MSATGESVRIALPLPLDEIDDAAELIPEALVPAQAHKGGSGRIDESRMWGYEIQPDDTLTGIFTKLGLPIQDLYQVLEADENVLALDNIKPGVELLVDIENDQLQTLELRFSPAHKVAYQRKQDAGFEFKETILPGTWKEIALVGEIGRSFSLDAAAEGLDARDVHLITRLLKEKINFRRDIRKGDSFEVLLSRQYIEDEPTGETKIEAVRMLANRSPVSIFYYDGSYYDEKGRSLSKAFLRYPFGGSYRVSSGFNPKRHHPVTGLFRPHNGTDFSMRTGTPILASGDGVVSRVVDHKYAGLYVEIKHSERYTTRYLHLSKSMVRKGQRVSRGQKIALSGASGRVTGPHLHYEFHIAGRPVDAVKAAIPITKQLEGKSRKEFDALLRQYMARLDAPREQEGADEMLISRRQDQSMDNPSTL
ncbi:subfamily M23B unassigned peptidase [Marinobacterium zhoushanense]|uniref:Subfamily M23B unassigned peptidase n=2 Tax=Marinobacterium zhoushanense TaxID=1679163 RepID=A0ABQ1K0J5_9GAMM|nr:subfamily M23B unassigned peptidase [Marinobacterium zhoushanense]